MGGDWRNLDAKYQPRNDKQPGAFDNKGSWLLCCWVKHSLIYDTVSLLKLHLERLGVKEVVDL